METIGFTVLAYHANLQTAKEMRNIDDARTMSCQRMTGRAVPR